jgi:hypothetical protein
MFCLAGLAPGFAHAGLGRGYDSVDTDRIHLGAKRHAQAVATHTVDTLTLVNGAVVREFSRPDGTVFAVAWRGPSRPDLQQLLGDQFAAFQAQATQAPATSGPARHVRRAVSLNRSDLVVQSAGHPGAFWGFAYVPSLAPSGFAMSNFK